jgi:hypothetical protein
MHPYIVVACKSQNRRTVHVSCILVKKPKGSGKVEYWMSYPLMVDCTNCGRTYDYPDSEEEFWQKALRVHRLDAKRGNRQAIDEFVDWYRAWHSPE